MTGQIGRCNFETTIAVAASLAAARQIRASIRQWWLSARA